MTSMESLIKRWIDEGIIKEENVAEAFRKADRKYFVPEEYQEDAYGDRPLHIGKNQTISQPTTVAIMTQALEPKPGQKILEIGSGSGWQSAVLSFIVGKKGKVITIEYIKELAEFARKNLRKLNIKNVLVIHGDGSKGYKKESPFDKIILTSAAPDFPKPLIEQLKDNGIILGPLGSRFEQEMVKARKVKGRLIRENLGGFIFVRLKGKYGF